MRSARRSITDLALHLHPRSVPASTLRLTLSLGLGGMAATLVGLLLATGALLLFVYSPTAQGAYGSILTLTREVPFGRWIRNIHYLSANLLAGIVLLHGLRVFLTGAFGPGRRLNWIIGLVLLALTLAANFTGYLLPWDQLAYWAAAICVNMLAYVPLCGDWLAGLVRGGAEVGAGTLSTFFTLHVTVVPVLLFTFMGWHFWLVRKAGGLARTEPGPGEPAEERLPVAPDLLAREAAFGLGLVALVLCAAMFLDAPLLAQANPAMSPDPAKAPWYFQGFQELLLHLDPVFAVFVWPVLCAAALVALPFWPGSAGPAGVWFTGPGGRALAGYSSLAGAVAAAGIIALDAFAPSLAQPGGLGGMHGLIVRGLVPTAALLAGFTAGYALFVKKFGRSRAQAVMALALFGFAAMAVCTAAGVWFRGHEMRLVWPFAGGA